MMMDDESVVDDFTYDELDLASTHSSDSPESEGDALEGDESLENCGNSGATNNNHTKDAMEDETTTTTFASSSQSNPTQAKSNHANDAMEDATTTTTYATSSRFDPTQAATSFEENFLVAPPGEALMAATWGSNMVS